jgi:acylphosphatase
MKHYHIIVQGKVQGVGFRYFTALQAGEFDLVGFVRNSEDGSVEIEVEGAEDRIKHFIEKVKGGSPFSRVNKLSYSEQNHLANFSSFKIHY